MQCFKGILSSCDRWLLSFQSTLTTKILFGWKKRYLHEAYESIKDIRKLMSRLLKVQIKSEKIQLISSLKLIMNILKVALENCHPVFGNVSRCFQKIHFNQLNRWNGSKDLNARTKMKIQTSKKTNEVKSSRSQLIAFLPLNNFSFSAVIQDRLTIHRFIERSSFIFSITKKKICRWFKVKENRNLCFES